MLRIIGLVAIMTNGIRATVIARMMWSGASDAISGNFWSNVVDPEVLYRKYS